MEGTQTKRNSVVEYLFDLNEQHSKAFINSQRSRRIYRVKHPTEIAVMKCMDGRVHIPVYTQTPLGIIQPWRNIGGKFDLGWPHYKETIQDWTDYCVSKGRKSLVFTTYHYAKGFEGESLEIIKYRGCAGFGYDTENAKAASLELKQQFVNDFMNDSIYVIQCGVETDFNTLIFHGDNGETLDLSEAKFDNEAEIIAKLQEMYPTFPIDVIKDIVPLVTGNIEHTAMIKKADRPKVDMEHKEKVLGFGRGFDSIHEPNFALIIGPYDIDLVTPIVKAAGLLLKNIKEGRVTEDEGLVLLACAIYSKAGSKQRLAERKARTLAKHAWRVIEEHVPEAAKYFKVVTVTCDLNTRKFNLLD
jgi:hypothetical protein